MCVKTCEHYIYLGSPFSLDGLTSSSIRINASLRMCQALKFVSFCHKNNDIPFYVKNKFFHAALMSSNIYGCESWLDGNIKPMENIYIMCIKHLLGVRKNTTWKKVHDTWSSFICYSSSLKLLYFWSALVPLVTRHHFP